MLNSRPEVVLLSGRSAIRLKNVNCKLGEKTGPRVLCRNMAVCELTDCVWGRLTSQSVWGAKTVWQEMSEVNRGGQI